MDFSESDRVPLKDFSGGIEACGPTRSLPELGRQTQALPMVVPV
jgi:hypothetical protein